jgi:predicted CoA-binding protein
VKVLEERVSGRLVGQERTKHARRFALSAPDKVVINAHRQYDRAFRSSCESHVMPSNHETFFTFDRYGVVGRSQVKAFPILSYRGLKALRKTVYAIDPSTDRIDGDPAYPDLAAVPGPIEGLLIETPKGETRDWVAAAAAAGIRDVWVHQGLETPEAVAAAGAAGINLRTGTCAVMYLDSDVSVHGLHKLIMKMIGRY